VYAPYSDAQLPYKEVATGRNPLLSMRNLVATGRNLLPSVRNITRGSCDWSQPMYADFIMENQSEK
jgi:hypothetical protein